MNSSSLPVLPPLSAAIAAASLHVGPTNLEHRYARPSMFVPLKPEPEHTPIAYAPMPVRPLPQFRFAPLAPPPVMSRATSDATAKPKKKTYEQMTKQEKRKARACRVEGCESYIINRGLCFRHGGGKRCAQPGCDSSAKNQGLCWKHGGSTSCIIEGCTRRGKARGLCWAHGGGTQCSTEGCTTIAVSNSKCWAHGGGKRCAYDGCTRAAYERTYNYCMKHHELLRDGRHSVDI